MHMPCLESEHILPLRRNGPRHPSIRPSKTQTLFGVVSGKREQRSKEIAQLAGQKSVDAVAKILPCAGEET